MESMFVFPDIATFADFRSEKVQMSAELKDCFT